MKTREIADFLSGELLGDGEVEIFGVAELVSAASGEIAFTTRADGGPTSASCLLAPVDFPADNVTSVIHVTDPKLAFSRVAEILHPPKQRPGEVHTSAVISNSATLGENVFVGPFVCIGENSEIGGGTSLRAGVKIGDNVRIGKGCVLDPNVFIEDNCTIGDNVILHSGVVIGTDGFGFVRDKERYVKFPQIGSVIIENNVEIGAHTCIDRGALDYTLIGEGTKIDNLVQIAHNVQIGKRVVIAAQTGISGSTVIEDDCVIGGQVGMGDHARVQSGAVIGSQAGVLPGKIVRPGVWWGTPIQPLDEYKRQNAHLKGIAQLKAEVKQLKEEVATLLTRH